MEKYTKWVAMYGNAMSISENRVEGYSRDTTLRYPIYVPFDGNKMRFTFDNFCGTEDITITKASVAVSDKNGNLKDSAVKITFGGNESITVQKGAKIVSDETEITVKRGDIVSVSLYFGDFTQMRSSVFAKGSHSGGYYSVGECVNDSEFDVNKSKKIPYYYFLSDIDIMTEEKNHALICYGDSITAQDWPDELIDRLDALGITNLSVIRKAASGTRLLRQYDNITYESYGLKGKNRVPREWDVAGADILIIQQGINDIIHPVGTDVNIFRPMSDLPTAKEMTDMLEWYISNAREKNYKVYLGTLLPIKNWRTYADFREVLKNEYNDWIRKTPLSDGCIDFDKAVRDESDTAAFKAEYNSGDNLHPSVMGYRKMAECIPEEILK